MEWHVNEGLAPLIDQMHHRYAGLIVGTIGDAAHSGTVSDHNPNKYGRVNAADFMHGGQFTPEEALKIEHMLIKDPRTKYLIHNRKIWQGEWHDYTGNDPHTNHIHLSVFDNARIMTGPWDLTGSTSLRKPEMLTFTVQLPIVRQGDTDATLDYGYPIIAMMQREKGITADGNWGPQTTRALGVNITSETLYRQLFGLSR